MSKPAYHCTNNRPYSVAFDDQDIIKIIRTLNINKAHGHDDISIRMIKILDSGLTFVNDI